MSMKNLEMWFGKLQDAKTRAENPDTDDCDRDIIIGELRNLYSAMEDNKPRKCKNQAFKLYLYKYLLNDVQSELWRIQRKRNKEE